jgi:putative ABC transport system ATP-binding protein
MNTTAAASTSAESVPQRALIQLEGLTRVFETTEVETHAISDVSLVVRAGEWVSITGPSGSGKTTLLAVLGLLDTANKGTYLMNGQSVLELSAKEQAQLRNRHIGFIFQSFNLIGDLSVYENVELPLTYRGMPAPEREARVEKALERVGMSHRLRHLPGQLSGGQQQRVAVARAVAGEPLILLADEPTGNLHSKNGESVMELLSELHQGGATLIMVTHDPAQAQRGTRKVSLLDGRVVQDEYLRQAPPPPSFKPVS